MTDLINNASFIIVIFIALCAIVDLYILNKGQHLIAGGKIKRGELVCMGADGRIYATCENCAPLGIMWIEQ